MISSRSVKIQWQQQLTDSTEVTKFLVQYQENHGECSQPLGCWPLSSVLGDLSSLLLQALAASF
jgi:hypothetical protein